MDFRQEYFCRAGVNPKWEIACKIAARYEVACETYDRRVCTGGIHPERGAMPIDGRERELILAHAREMLVIRRRESESAGISEGMMQSATHYINRYPFETLKRIAEERSEHSRTQG